MLRIQLGDHPSGRCFAPPSAQRNGQVDVPADTTDAADLGDKARVSAIGLRHVGYFWLFVKVGAASIVALERVGCCPEKTKSSSRALPIQGQRQPRYNRIWRGFSQ